MVPVLVALGCKLDCHVHRYIIATFEYPPGGSAFAPVQVDANCNGPPHPLPCRICRKLEAEIQAGKNHHGCRKQHADLAPAGTSPSEYCMHAVRLPSAQPIQSCAAGAEKSPDQVRVGAGLHRTFQKQGMPQHGRRQSGGVPHGRSLTGGLQDITASPSDLSMLSMTELSGPTASDLSSLLHSPAPGHASKETPALADMGYKPRGGGGCSLADLLKAKYNRVEHHQRARKTCE